MALTVKSIVDGRNDLGNKYVPDFNDLKRLVEVLKEAGYTIVLTQGVYDMFHVGHGRYLKDAAAFGDILIVGIDSDELTREMKGDDRPFDEFDERIELLSMLWFVRIITRRDVGQHMHDLIKLVRPDVLVMSKTTKSFTEEDKEILKEYCGRIEHLEPKAPPERVSTTAKILRLHREGAKAFFERLKGAFDREFDSFFEGGDSNA